MIRIDILIIYTVTGRFKGLLPCCSLATFEPQGELSLKGYSRYSGSTAVILIDWTVKCHPDTKNVSLWAVIAPQY